MPRVGGPWSRHPAPDLGAPLSGALPLSLVEPGRATAGSSLLEPPRDGCIRLSQPPGFVPGRSRGRGRCTDFFLRLARVRAPNPSPRPLVLWLGPEGSAGRAGRGYPGDGVGVQVAGVGAAQRSSTSPRSLGGDVPPGAANSPHSRGGGNDGHPATGFGVSPCPSEGARSRR